MKKDILEDRTLPFTVPSGYFDSLQRRIMGRVVAEERRLPRGVVPEVYQPFTLRCGKWIAAAAACILLALGGTALLMTYTDKPLTAAEMAIDEDFYQWFYASDRPSLMAASLDISEFENLSADEADLSDEDAEIIHYLERDNIHVADILYAVNNEDFNYQTQ